MEAQNNGRPFVISVISVLALIIGVINLLRVAQTLLNWEFIDQLLPFTPAILAGTGLVWGITGLVLSWSLWIGCAWTLPFTRIVSIIYVLYLWTDRLLLREPTGREENDPFVAGLSVVLVLVLFWILSRKNVKAYFGETDE